MAESYDAKSLEEKIAESHHLDTFFKITSVTRGDVQSAGFDVSDVSDEDMELLARKMEDAYVGSRFWDDLDIIAEYLEFTRE